jgi:hypothetical protein
LAKVARKAGWDGKNIKKLKTIMHDQTDFRPAKVEETDLINLTQAAWKKKQDRSMKRKLKAKAVEGEAVVATGERFKVDEPAILAQIQAEANDSPKDFEEMQRNIAIYTATKEPLAKAETIAGTYQITTGRVTQIQQKMAGKVAEIAGHLYEKHHFQEVKNLFMPKGGVVELGAGEGEWDIRVTLPNKVIYISVKCLNIKPTRPSFSLSYKECRPEIEAAQADAKAGKSAYAFIHVYNVWTGEIFEKDIESQIIDDQWMLATYSKKSFLIHHGEGTLPPSANPPNIAA